MKEISSLLLCLSLLLTTIHIPSVGSMPKIASRLRVRMPRECETSLCNFEGTCEISPLGYARCNCYTQFFRGVTCREVASNCLENAQGCISSQSEECWDYFGSNHCVCKKYFYGKRCQHYGYVAQFATFLAILYRHQPTTSVESTLFLAYVSRGNTRKFTFKLDGFTFEYFVQNFSTIDPKQLKKMIFKLNFLPTTVVKEDVTIPQQHYLAVRHNYLHPGRKKMVLMSHITYRFTEPWSYWNQFTSGVSAVWGKTKDYGGQLIGGVMNVGSGAVNIAGSVASGVASGVGTVVSGTLSGVGSVVSGTGSLAMGAAHGVASGVGAVVGAAESITGNTLGYMSGVPILGGMFGSIGSALVSASESPSPSSSPSSSDSSDSSSSSWFSGYLPSVGDYIPSPSNYIPSVSGVASYIPGASLVSDYMPSVGGVASYIPGASYVSSWWSGDTTPEEKPPEYDDKYQLDREWDEVRASNAHDEAFKEVKYEDGNKITTVKLIDRWTFEYEPVMNGSVCSPDLNFRGGVCSVFSELPSVLLKNKLYRFDTATLNVCGKDSILPEAIYYYKYVGDAMSLPISQVKAVHKTFPKVFKLSSTKPKPFHGWVIQIVAEATEIDELKAEALVRPRETSVGRDVCWIKYHMRLAPVVELDCGAHISMNSGDHPTVRSTVSFIDDINKNIPDTMGGYLTFSWECYKTAYGWIYLHGCDNWFTSNERDKTLNFWWSVEGNVKFTACAKFDKDKYHVDEGEGCSFTQFVLLAYYGLWSSWTQPLFFLTCMQNCGQGTEIAYSEVDRGEIIFLRATCQARCENVVMFSWYFNGVILRPDSDVFLPETVEYKNMKPGAFKTKNYKMVRPYAFTILNKAVEIQAVGSDDKTYAWGKFYLRFWSAPPSNAPLFNKNCQEPLTFKGVAFYTDFFLCIRNINPSTPVTISYYQSVSEFDSKLGVMIGHGQAPYLKDAILASSMGRSVITIVVANDVHGSEYYDAYEEIEVLAPEERSAGPYSHITLIHDIFLGKSRKNRLRPSVLTSARKNELIELVQKLHVIIVELTQIGLSKHISDQLEINAFRNKIIQDSISVISELRTTLPIDIVQLTSVLFEYAYIDALPMDYSKAEAIMNALDSSLANFDNVVKADWTYRQKPYRVLRIVGPVLNIISAVIYPASSTFYSTLNEPMSKFVTAVTKDLIKLTMAEENLNAEDYPAYQSELDYLRDKINRYANTTLKAMNTIKSIMTTLCETLNPAARAKEIFWPQLELETVGATKIYLYAKLDEVAFFHMLNFQIGEKQTFVINFTKPLNVSKETKKIIVWMVSVNTMPFWWQITSFMHMQMLVQISVLTDKGLPIESNYSVRYSVPAKRDDYSRGNAISMDKIGSDSMVSCHVMRIPPHFPGFITASFERSVYGTLKVIPKKKRCPKIEEFYKMNLVNFVGPQISNPTKEGGSMRSTQNYVVEHQMQKKNFTTFLFFGIVSSRGAISYGVQFHSSQCSAWREKHSENFSATNFYWDDSRCDNTKLLESGSVLKCDCITSNETNMFSVIHSLLDSRVYGWMAISIDYRPRNYFLLIVLGAGLVMIFGFLFGVAYIIDTSDEEQKKVLYLVDNRPLERYMYVIVMITGSASPSICTSHIGIKLYGSRDNSKRHVLVGVRERRTFQRMGIDFFGLSTASALGKIRAVELWSDFRGHNPAWYCEKVIVRDYHRMVEWVFVVKKWFSLVHTDHHLHRILYQTKVAPADFFYRIFTSEDILLHHIWLGMFSREHCHAFSRKYKVMMAYSIINVCLLVLLFLIGIPQFQNDALADIGHVHIDEVFSNAAVALVISIVVNYPFLYVLKNSQVDKNFSPYYYDFSGVDPAKPYPFYRLSYHAKFYAWIAVGLMGLLCLGILFFTGFFYGIRKSQLVMASLIVCLVLDMVFVETIHVIIRGFIWRGIMKENDVKRFCNEVIDINCLEDYPLANSRNKELLLKKDMAQPMSSPLYRTLFQRERYFAFYAHTLKDLLLYTCFLLVFFALMTNYRDSYSYYNSEVMENLVVNARYTRALALENISSFHDLLDYLNYTLLLTVHWQTPCWFPDTDVKLIGVVRLRQHRVAPYLIEPCLTPTDMEPFRFYCIPDFTASVMDTNAYGVRWTPYENSPPYSLRMKTAFVYQTGQQTATVGRRTVTNYVPSGGYVVTLGRNTRNSRTVLNTLHLFKWFDDYTRLVSIDFTTLNVHANLFTFVSLTIERSATGNYIPSYNIKSMVLENRKSFGHGTEFVLFILLFIILVLMVFQQSQAFMHRHDSDATAYIWMFLDLVVLLSASCVVYYIYIKFYSLYSLYATIEQSPNNTFVSFGKVLRMQLDIRVIGSLLLFLSFIRVWKLLRFSRKYQTVEYLSYFSKHPILWLVIVMLVFFAMAVMMFHLVFGTKFMIWWNFSTIPNHIEDYTEGFVTIGLLFLIFKLLIRNFFIAVIVVNYCKARKIVEKKMNRFTFGLYIKERIFRRDTSDVIRMGYQGHLEDIV